MRQPKNTTAAFPQVATHKSRPTSNEPIPRAGGTANAFGLCYFIRACLSLCKAAVDACSAPRVGALAADVVDDIAPDRTTALTVWQVLRKLVPFIGAAGAELPDEPDLSRFVDLIKTRRKQTHARYRRSGKQRRCSGSPASRP
jgi:hypothetical protein